MVLGINEIMAIAARIVFFIIFVALTLKLLRKLKWN